MCSIQVKHSSIRHIRHHKGPANRVGYAGVGYVGYFSIKRKSLYNFLLSFTWEHNIYDKCDTHSHYLFKYSSCSKIFKTFFEKTFPYFNGTKRPRHTFPGNLTFIIELFLPDKNWNEVIHKTRGNKESIIVKYKRAWLHVAYKVWCFLSKNKCLPKYY